MKMNYFFIYRYALVKDSAIILFISVVNLKRRKFTEEINVHGSSERQFALLSRYLG